VPCRLTPRRSWTTPQLDADVAALQARVGGCGRGWSTASPPSFLTALRHSPHPASGLAPRAKHAGRDPGSLKKLVCFYFFHAGREHEPPILSFRQSIHAMCHNAFSTPDPQADSAAVAAASCLKDLFVSRPQALLHGDLHTGATRVVLRGLYCVRPIE
jgi:hypothetical protein